MEFATPSDNLKAYYSDYFAGDKKNISCSFEIPAEYFENGVNVYIDPSGKVIFSNYEIPCDISSVIFSPPATIVFWNDRSKTVVKTSPHDEYDKEKGILWAYFIKHANGSKTKLQKEIRKWVEKD